MFAATIHAGGDKDTVRARILASAKAQGIVSTPDSGYHESITCFRVKRIAGLTAALGRGACAGDAARAIYHPSAIPDILRA